MNIESNQPSHLNIPFEVSITLDQQKNYNDGVIESKEKNELAEDSYSIKSSVVSANHNSSDITNSFDTTSLLNQLGKIPQYSNTSHINMVHTPVNQNTSNTSCKNEDNLINQVPKRFSRFIYEQQNPQIQKLDNLSLNSISIYSLADAKSKGMNQSLTSNMKKRTDTLGRLSDADSASQTTIFSTRQASKLMLDSPTKIKSNSSLMRSKAIRFKEGGWYYRLKLRVKKFAKKLRALRFNNFRVPSKRTGSIKRTGTIVKLPREKTLKRKYRQNPQNIAVKRLTSKDISVPYSNPHLGQGEIKRVDNLNNELKQEAGAFGGSHNNADIKHNQMSEYIGEQQDSYINSMYTKTKSSSINYGNNSLNTKAKRHTYNSISDIEEIPPTPPPHLEHNNFSTVQGEDANDVIGIWSRYLRHVISQRIQLRQEIVFFQALAANRNSGFVMDDLNIDTKDNYELQDESEYASDSQKTISESAYETETDAELITISSPGSGITEDSDVANSPTNEFSKIYNRRSLLGEMLDYDSSDNELVSSSVYSNSSQESRSINAKYEDFVRRANSTASSNLEIGKRYGTVVRKNTITLVPSRNQSLRIGSTFSNSMKRSRGYLEGLNEVY